MPENFEKTCFIIMPITTPDVYIDKYRDCGDHFKHVLECLFIPSVKKAGYEPIPPVAKGSDLIHAEIIKNLESADMVLCDMSCLNPNVFFEWGIRTALNKPICIVKDELPLKIPFDTGIINFEPYKSTIEPWELQHEIEKLSLHVKTSHERSKNENTLWKYFGIKTEAHPTAGRTSIEEKVDLLMMQFDSLKQQRCTATEHIFPSSASKDVHYLEPQNEQIIMHFVSVWAPHDVSVIEVLLQGELVNVMFSGHATQKQLSEWRQRIKESLGKSVVFTPCRKLN